MPCRDDPSMYQLCYASLARKPQLYDLYGDIDDIGFTIRVVVFPQQESRFGRLQQSALGQLQY